ncbi:hypothetical protein HY994_06520 [Candidatus Micrarchaeota archaeon]|nr:hypothetical protein [Candidatus Micrarchaeota archaeon]
MHMVKVISLSEPAYNLLKSLKGKSQSFSDVIMEKLGKEEPKKTETMQDLIDWIESQPKLGKKVRWSEQVDEIVYGVKR